MGRNLFENIFYYGFIILLILIILILIISIFGFVIYAMFLDLGLKNSIIVILSSASFFGIMFYMFYLHEKGDRKC